MPNLDEIKARREKVPSPPWHTDEWGMYIWQTEQAEEGYIIADTHSADSVGGIVGIRGWGHLKNKHGEEKAEQIQKHTADFIANAPTDIDWLIDVYETAVFELLRQADCVCRMKDGSFNSSAVTHQADILHALEKLGLFNITGFGSYRYVWGHLTPEGEEMMKKAWEVQYDF